QMSHRNLEYTLFPYTTLFRSLLVTMNWSPMRYTGVETSDQRLVGLKAGVDSRTKPEPLAGHERMRSVPLRAALNVGGPGGVTLRSEEHTSELQSRSDLVCRLL